MTMKRFGSVLCAAALAMTMSVPVLANATPGDTATPGGVATPGNGGSIVGPVKPNGGSSEQTPVPALPNNATPGQVVNNLAQQLLRNPANFDLAKRVVELINYDRNINVDSTTVSAVMRAIYNNPTYVSTNHGKASFNVAMHATNKGLNVVAENAYIEGDRAVVGLHFEDINKVEAQPQLGAIVSVTFKNETMPSNKDYVVIGEGNRMIDYAYAYNTGKDTVVTFWAPHFSTYVVLPRDQYVAPTQGQNGGAAAASNAIKKTGMDMSFALASVVAMAGAAVVGGAASAKKSKAE